MIFKMVAVKFCPKCKSEDVMMVAGGEIGIWMCKKCGFRGSVFPEKEILGGTIEGKEEKK
ncbi:hypothetical protein CMI47_11355 [Candidatus Pacearchaeota archaeon]|nr:hypothetical protein [Candidatus Pacearchaeota archaeon]